MIKFVDMFSGIGGFREGLTRAGGFECVGHCEIDKYANRSYNALFDRRESGSLKMPEKPTPAPCRTSSCSAADSLARLIPNKIRSPKPSRESLRRKDFCIKTSG